MAKRKKRKHRPSAKYITFAQRKQKQSIIPTITPRAKTSKAETKALRDSIRKAYSEQIKVTIPTPKATYTSNKKKNRKEARQKRKEKKQKAKQLQQQRQIQQEEPEPIPTLDYGERDEDFRSEDGEIDDTVDYIEQLISKIQYVYEGLQEKYGKWYGYKGSMFTDLDRALYYLEDALDFPYEYRLVICNTLEANSFLEEVNKVLSFEHYKEVEASLEAISQEIVSIIESAY